MCFAICQLLLSAFLACYVCNKHESFKPQSMAIEDHSLDTTKEPHQTYNVSNLAPSQGNAQETYNALLLHVHAIGKIPAHQEDAPGLKQGAHQGRPLRHTAEPNQQG